MSEENVEAMRQALDAFNRRDRAAWLAVCDPEAEDVPPWEWPESDATQGSEAMWDLYVGNMGPWDGPVFEYSDFIEAGANAVVAHFVGDVKGKASGAPVAWNYWQVGTFRDGKLLRLEWFPDRVEAFEAAGLRE
jgi:ketosteroid isomerase-like protein